MSPWTAVSRFRNRESELSRLTIRAVLSGSVAAMWLFGATQLVTAQSTIFNIPTTDTVAKGKAYFEFDFLPQIPKPDGSNRLFLYDPRIVVGVAPNVEAGANGLFSHTAGTTSVFFQPNLKWRFFNNDGR